MRPADTLCPKYEISETPNSHFDHFAYNLLARNCDNTHYKCSLWVAISGEYTKISSRYTATNLPSP